MNMKPVKSSNIAAVGYDAERQVMRVQFTNGTAYDYTDVPADAHAALIGAESVGKHFHKHVKPNYMPERVPRREGGAA